MQQDLNGNMFDNAYDGESNFSLKNRISKFKRFAPILGVPPGIETLTRRGHRLHVVHTGRVNHAEKKKKRKLFKKLGGAIKKGAKFVKKVTLASVAIPALLPLMPVMVKALKSKGIKPPKGVQKVARLFYEQIVQKKGSKFEAVNFDDYAAEDSVLPLVAIVPPVIKFVKELVDKKKSGQPLNSTEKEIADAATPVISKIEAVAGGSEVLPNAGSNEKGMQGNGDTDAPAKSTGFSLSPTIIIGAVVAVVVLFFVLKK